MFKLFSQHPRQVNETYWQHACFACSVGIRMILGGIVCLIHAIFPFLFPNTASRIIISLYQKITSGSRGAIN